jgi:hypothetical protein
MAHPNASQSPGKRATQHNAELAVKQRKAVELRVTGLTLDEIADRLGYADASGAYRAVKRGLLETQRPAADELRELLTRRYEALLIAVWPKATSGDLNAIRTAGRLLDSLSRLLVPLRVEQVEGSASEVDESIAALVAELERRAGAGPGPAQLDPPPAP